jgi:SAM-dependent methyltransferase
MAQLVEFYSGKHADGLSLLAHWDAGLPVGDSITPSIYYASYRTLVVSLVTRLTDRVSQRGILSLGCGNGHVEKRLMELGYSVEAVDIVPEAVKLARDKGIRAFLGDARTWTSDHRYGLVLADGVVGHLYNAETNSLDGLSHIAQLLEPGGSLLILADSPMEAAVEEVANIPNYWWLSLSFIKAQVIECGLDPSIVTTHEYKRPKSGVRKRSIIGATRR